MATKPKPAIEQLANDLHEVRRAFFSPSTEHTVNVPEAFESLFEVAERTVAEYFRHAVADPSKGTIEIGDQRYVLVRASGLSIDFLETVRELYGERPDTEALAIGRSFLYDIAHTIGFNDARDFHSRMNVTDPIAKLSAGPVHFAYSGWASVHIKPESNAVPNEDYVLIYEHPYSFEADSWVRAGRHSDSPVCIMNAGYSSGWCQASFGIKQTSVEVMCKAKGDESCTFIMAPPDRIEERITEFFGDEPQQVRTAALEIPHLFESKHTEELRSRFIERVILVQDEERRRIAREVHDELGSLLTSLTIGLREIETGQDAGEMRERASKLRKVAQLSLEDANRIARGLHPTILDNLGLVAAVEHHVEHFSSVHKIDVEFEVRGLDGPQAVTRPLDIALYRIIQESLTNCAKHGRAKNVSVVITAQKNELRLVIEDDGVGMNTAAGGERGLGLQGIRERVALLKGKVEIESSPGAGCTVAVQVPVDATAGLG